MAFAELEEADTGFAWWWLLVLLALLFLLCLLAAWRVRRRERKEAVPPKEPVVYAAVLTTPVSAPVISTPVEEPSTPADNGKFKWSVTPSAYIGYGKGKMEVDWGGSVPDSAPHAIKRKKIQAPENQPLKTIDQMPDIDTGEQSAKSNNTVIDPTSSSCECFGCVGCFDRLFCKLRKPRRKRQKHAGSRFAQSTESAAHGSSSSTPNDDPASLVALTLAAPVFPTTSAATSQIPDTNKVQVPPYHGICTNT